MQRAKIAEKFAEAKKSLRKIFQNISQKMEKISLLLEFRIFLDIFKIFAEECFLLGSFRKFLPSGFCPYAVSSPYSSLKHW